MAPKSKGIKLADSYDELDDDPIPYDSIIIYKRRAARSTSRDYNRSDSRDHKAKSKSKYDHRVGRPPTNEPLSRGPRLPGMRRDESFWSTSAEAGDSPYEEPTMSRPQRPNLFSENSWSSVKVEDGSDEDFENSIAFGDTFVDEECYCSECSGREMDTYKPSVKMRRPLKRKSKPVVPKEEGQGKGSVFDLIFVYGFICILIVILKSIPGFFSSFFGWDAWIGGDEVGAEGDIAD
ncbi:hypothetical protein TWF281_006623 [Arthrobotrys megalospora]